MKRRGYSIFSIFVSAITVLLALRKQPQAVRSPSRLGPSATPAAHESAGFGAEAPEDIPASGWWQIAQRTARKFSDNELMSEAASVTFFALLSLFPAVTAIVSLYGLFADPRAIGAHLDAAAGFVPSGGMEIIQEQIKRLTASPASGLSIGAIVGVLTALWSANQGSKAMFSALNDVYGEHEVRSFLHKTATSLAFTVGGIACLLLAVGAIIVVPVAFRQLGYQNVLDLLIKAVRWPILLAGVILGLAVLYRYGPSRRPARWRWVTWGGVIAAILWLGLSAGFSWYVEHFGSYNKTYGSLGAVIGFMTWMWLSSTVLLLGAQINAEMEAQTGCDTTVGQDRQRGARDAAVADQLAAK